MYLPFPDWFGSQRTSVWIQINRKMVNTIWFRVKLIRFRKDFSDHIPLTGKATEFRCSAWIRFHKGRTKTSPIRRRYSFQIEWNMIVQAVLRLIWNGIEMKTTRTMIFLPISEESEIYFSESRVKSNQIWIAITFSWLILHQTEIHSVHKLIGKVAKLLVIFILRLKCIVLSKNVINVTLLVNV